MPQNMDVGPDRCREVIGRVYGHYQPFLEREEDGGLRLIDPVDRRVIGFHYGETHMGGAFVLGGLRFDEPGWVSCGVGLLKSFFNHAREFQEEPAYHWDFNNFALCAVFEYLEKADRLPELRAQIRAFVPTQKDSDNATVNWLPMRIYVNEWKYRWTQNPSYRSLAEALKGKIRAAQYRDGFFEDLLPKGTSFNFQYHIFTAALLAFLKIRGTDIADLAGAAAQAADLMDACGDVNYLGRGANQIFAWGPALYLYAAVGNATAYRKGFDYILGRSLTAIDRDNLIVNEFDGHEKGWWWDYHYCSVYIAHYAFWLALTATETGALELLPADGPRAARDSGVSIRKGRYCVVLFDGRKHYLAESGKVIADISCGDTACFKGAFGPYFREYGYRYAAPDDSLHNFIGLLQRRPRRGALCLKPVYPETIGVAEEGETLRITLSYGKAPKDAAVNLPWFLEGRPPRVLNGDGREIAVRLTRKFKGPYGWVFLYQSHPVSADQIEIVIGE